MSDFASERLASSCHRQFIPSSPTAGCPQPALANWPTRCTVLLDALPPHARAGSASSVSDQPVCQSMALTPESRSSADLLEALETLESLEPLAILERLELLTVFPDAGRSFLARLGAKNQRPETGDQKLRLDGLQLDFRIDASGGRNDRIKSSCQGFARRRRGWDFTSERARRACARACWR